jgi:protein phosphatase
MTSQANGAPEARVELASRSDVGRVRSANEDSCDVFVREDGTRLLVVADGMGGHQGGATASRLAVATISETFERDTDGDTRSMIRRAIQTANTRVFELAEQDEELSGMGTTVVALLLDPEYHATVAHVGDSRAYRYRLGRLEPITVDHSVVAEMHRRGLISADEAAIHPRRNEILRSVGVLPEVDVEVATVDVAPGDRFVLCSDGLTGVVRDEEIAAVVQSEPPARAVDVLVEMANERGGPDNITVQVLAVPPDAETGDPEATAPVEISEVGIQAIETQRRERLRMQRLGTALGVAAVVIVVLVLLRALLSPSDGPDPGTTMPDPAPDTRPTAPTPDPLGGRPAPGAAPAPDPEPPGADAPRRGIPR